MVPVIDEPDPATPPVIPPVTVGALHEYVVPVGAPDGVIVNAVPLHTVVV
jgi:hypothetical protein